jgi:pimeloyl-ACP methyl ester carboxylesterase
VAILYLHGFASGPQSKKGVAFAQHFAPRRTIERLNLRVPSFEHLRLSAMIDAVRAAIDPDDHAILIGSSLGGLTAARVAERDDRVRALVLLAPAFQLVARWREQLGAAAFDTWRDSGWREVPDYSTGGMSRIDYGFIEDAESIDIGYPAVRVPTLILHGLRDEVVPIERSRTVAAGQPHIRLVELDDNHELVASLPTLLRETERFLDVLP